MSILTRLASGVRTRELATRDLTPAPDGTSGVRAPIVGTANLAYTGRGLPQVPNWDARSAVEQGYLGSPAVYSAVRTIAETVAALPFRAGKDPTRPGEYDHNAPLARLLGPAPGGPNPTTSSRALWAWTVAQRIVTGRMGWELERAPRSKQIINVWPLVSQYLQPIPTVSTPGQARPTTYFGGYRYNLPDGFINLPAANVFYSWRPSQSDWRQPETVMQAARIPISISIALGRYHWGMLNNGMAGRKMIITSPFAEPDHRRAFQEQFLAEMTGFDNAGKPAFAEATTDFDPSTGKASPPTVQVVDLAQTSTDAQLMALMEYMERAIYKAFSVPESEIGDASQRTYCADDTTEVLTADGWRRHDQVAAGTAILTLNHRTGSAEWQPIQNVNRFDVTDEPMLYMTGRGHDSLTTEAHRWPVLSRSIKEQTRSWKLSADLTEQHSIITAAPVSDLPTEQKYSDDFVELVAWHWTEGHVTRTQTGALSISVITQSEEVNADKCARIRGVMERLFGTPRDSHRSGDGEGWRERHDQDRDMARFILGRNVTESLEQVAPDRRPSEAFIRSLTRAQLDLFIDLSMMADGTRTNMGSKVITQSKAERLDGIELAAILSGRTPYRWESQAHDVRAGHCYHLAVSDRTATKVPRKADSDFASAHREWTTYTGTVWCPTVGNGTWFARRNGKVYFTGNSNAGEEYRVFWTRTIVPLLAEIADDINTYLAPQLGDEVGWFDLSGVEVLKPSSTFQPDTPTNLVKAGIVAPGEVREDLHLPYDLPAGPGENTPNPAPAVDDPDINPTTHSSTSRSAEPVEPPVEPVVVDVRHDVITRIDEIVARRESVKAGVRVENSPSDVGNTERLMAYWAEGKGAAKIRWGVDGDFDRCRVELGKYVGPKMVDGLCANLHHRATGAWPGHAPGESKPKARDAAVETESGSAGLFLPKAPTRLPKPVQAHVYRPSKADRRKCATCGNGVTAAGHLHTAARQAIPAVQTGKATVAAVRHRGPHLPVKGGHANTPERARQAVRKMIDRHVTGVEIQMADVLRRLFADQAKATVSRMNGNRGKQMIKAALRAAGDNKTPTGGATPAASGAAAAGASGTAHEPTPLIDPAHIFDQTYWTDRTAQDVRSIMTAVGAWVPGHFATHTPGVSEVEDDSAAVQSVQALLASATNRIAGQITQETFGQLTQALTDGVVAGDGYGGLATRVQQVFENADRVRAETIARTEIQSAVNSAQLSYSQSLPPGVVGSKEWLAQLDSRTRPAHAAAEGQQRPLGEPFDVGGASLMFPADPSGPPDQVIQCRCTLLFLPA